MTTAHVAVNVRTHQHAITHTSMIQILASVLASLSSAHLISTLTMIHVVVSVVKNQPVRVTNISTNHRASASVEISRSVVLGNTTITIHVIASAKIHQLAMPHTIMIQIHVNVYVNHMTAMLVYTLTPRAVAASAQSTRRAQTINTSMIQLASVNAVM